MAGVALRRGLDMLGMLTGSQGTIVAARTAAADLEVFVIETDLCPVSSRCMTTVALPGGGYMLGGFAGGSGTVMAAGTGAGDIGMIESACTPGDRVMAILTRLCGWNVGIGFSDRIHIVMTTLTATGYIGVIESHTAPVLVRDVAVVTRCSSLHMIR